MTVDPVTIEDKENILKGPFAEVLADCGIKTEVNFFSNLITSNNFTIKSHEKSAKLRLKFKI